MNESESRQHLIKCATTNGSWLSIFLTLLRVQELYGVKHSELTKEWVHFILLLLVAFGRYRKIRDVDTAWRANSTSLFTLARRAHHYRYTGRTFPRCNMCAWLIYVIILPSLVLIHYKTKNFELEEPSSRKCCYQCISWPIVGSMLSQLCSMKLFLLVANNVLSRIWANW